jgi:hypothetical protein
VGKTGIAIRVVKQYDIETDKTVQRVDVMTSGRKHELLEQKAELIAYCQSKLKAGDWHAVQDAASDIRELDAQIELLTELEK